jgi:hypothetical protein
LPVDVEFLKSISEPNSLRAYNRALQEFVTLLNNHMKSGLLTPSYFFPTPPVFPEHPIEKNAKK